MKYLVDTDDNVINMPEGVVMFKSVISFLDFKIKSEYSTDFSIPNTSENRSILGVFGLNDLNRVTSKSFTLYNNGVMLSRGVVFIREVSEVINLFFVAGNYNWFNRLTGSIKDLDMSEYDKLFTAANVMASHTATSGVVFPIIDWAYNYKKLSNNFFVKEIKGVSIDSFFDFYPCVYLHTIVSKLFDTYGLKYAGNLFTDQLYKSIIITTDQILSPAYGSSVNKLTTEYMTGVGQYVYGGPALVEMDSGSSYFNDSGDRLTIPSNLGTKTVVITITCSDGYYTGDTVSTIYLYKNGVQIKSVTNTWTGNFQTQNINVDVDLKAGDYLQAYINHNKSIYIIVTAARLEIQKIETYNTGNIFYVSSVLPDISQVNFIKYLCTRFNCLVDYDDNTETLTFTKLDSISPVDALDLSDNVIEYSFTPLTEYAERNYIRSAEASELVTYKVDNLNYGDLRIDSNGVGSIDIINIPFRPAETARNTNLDWLLTSVPLIRLEDSSDPIPYTTVTNSSGNALFNGADFNFTVDTIVRADGDYKGFFVVKTATATQVTPYEVVTYTGTGVGNLYIQRISFNNAGSRELIHVPSITTDYIDTGAPVYGASNIKITDTTGTYSTSTISFAYYAKPNINTSLDTYRVGLNFGEVSSTNNVVFSDIYFRNLREVIGGSICNAKIRLSNVEYYNLDLTRMVYIANKDFQGYFLIESIDGYEDENTPVSVKLRHIQ